jgi:hypothetical protein
MRYIVTAGGHHYPMSGIGDWQGVFDEYYKAEAMARTLKDDWVRIIYLYNDGTYHAEIWR